MQCNQCGRPAIRMINNHPLCVNCYATMQRVINEEIEMAQREIEFLGQEMEYIAGFRSSPPQYAPKVPIHMSAPTFNNLHISNSSVGVLNTGTIQRLDSSITSINDGGASEVAAALQQITQAVVDAKDLSDEARRDALGMLNVLADEARNAPAERSRAVIKSMLAGLESTVNASASLVTLWPVVAPVLGALLS